MLDPPDPVATEASKSTGRPGRRLVLWAVAAGVLVGMASWVGGEIARGSFHSALVPRIVAFPTGADRDRIIWNIVKSDAATFIQQGVFLGLVLGLTGGLARRSVKSGLVAAAAGVTIGAAAAAGSAYGLLPIYYRNVDPEANALAIPMFTHGGIWSATGAAAGLAFGLGLGGRGRWARCALGGFLGGIIATMVYDLVGALAFPLDKTSQPVAATVATRLFAQLAVAISIAASAALGAKADDAPAGPSSTA